MTVMRGATRLDERFVVALGLPGIGRGNLGQRLVERGARAAVAGDDGGVARLGMGQWPAPAA